jgi:endonuclease YncB( thermonuclease family)
VVLFEGVDFMTRTLALLLVVLMPASIFAQQASTTAAEKATSPQTFKARVARVIDGDTIQVVREGASTRVELAGVDCPESGQPFAADARKHTTAHALRKDALFTVTDEEETLRAVVTVAEPSLNEDLLARGLAWYDKETANDPKLAELEAEAREKKLGLWSDPDPVPPWEWRELPPEERIRRAKEARQGGAAASVAGTSTGAARAGSHWLNVNSNVRHNPSCTWYENTKDGRACAANEGRPCGLCGG